MIWASLPPRTGLRRKGFAKMIQNIDRDTGRIIDLVRELKIADNTVVIFTDNGPHQEGGHQADYFNSTANCAA